MVCTYDFLRASLNEMGPVAGVYVMFVVDALHIVLMIVSQDRDKVLIDIRA